MMSFSPSWSTSLSPAWFGGLALAPLQVCKAVNDTLTVVNYRLALLNRMASNPGDAMNPLNWLEVNLMVTEKLIAVAEANVALAAGVASLPLDRPPSARQLSRLQKQAMQPINSTLTANARRLRKRR